MNPPLLSIVTPVYNTEPAVLDACLASLAEQSFTDWEHCLVDDASTGPEVRALLAAAAAADPRYGSCRSTNGGIVAASNDALAMATGEFVALFDHDDLLTPGVMAAVATALRRGCGVGLPLHRRGPPHRRRHDVPPDVQARLVAGTVPLAHVHVSPLGDPALLGARRRRLPRRLRGVAGLRPDPAGHRTGARRVRHLPIIGYHWRMGPDPPPPTPPRSRTPTSPVFGRCRTTATASGSSQQCRCWPSRATTGSPGRCAVTRRSPS